MADTAKETGEKTLDALKGQEIDGENIKGGISVSFEGWYCDESGHPQWGTGSDCPPWEYIGFKTGPQPGYCRRPVR